MNLDRRLLAFEKLSLFIDQTLDHSDSNKYAIEFQKVIESEQNYNPWFIPSFVNFSLSEIARITRRENLNHILEKYDFSATNTTETIATVMAGNIPLVGFADFFDILICGKNFLGKLSSQDQRLLPYLAQILGQIEPEFNPKIQFTTQKLENFNKVIATGSNNSAALFQQYFKDKPHIIRHHRSSVALLTGQESDQELESLADDICLYFGMGCRNVSKIYIPKNYDFSRLIKALKKYESVLSSHSHYLNNLTYLKSIFYINKTDFIDAGIMVLKEETSLKSYISCLGFEYYDNLTNIYQSIKNSENIQCVVSKNGLFENTISFGQSQKPNILDFADHVDVLAFCLK